MKFISINRIYEKAKNKYLACIIIAKRAKKYNAENYEYFIKSEKQPPEGVKKTNPVEAAIDDFLAGELDDKIKEYE